MLTERNYLAWNKKIKTFLFDEPLYQKEIFLSLHGMGKDVIFMFLKKVSYSWNYRNSVYRKNPKISDTRKFAVIL